MKVFIRIQIKNLLKNEMGSESSSTELWTVRLFIGIPMIIMILYAINILRQPHLIISVVQVFVLFIAIALGLIVLFATSRVAIPWKNVERKHAEYFVEELKEQDKVFVIPTVCPHCKTEIALDKVWWEDKHTPLCHECQAKLKLRIVEK